MIEEELKKWLEDCLKIYSEINNRKMNDLLAKNISNRLYTEIPYDENKDSHLGKVDYMMNMMQELQQPKEKTKLNLVIADGSSSMEYIQYLSTDYEVNVVNFKDVKNRKDIDLVLFTGGEDVDPELYGETKGEFTYINKARDKKEREVFNFFKGYAPMLGVCRGNQLLCVLNGGRLIQHVEGHGRDHTIVVKGYSSPISITSTHHQMVYPFNLKEENYELIAYSEYFKSNTYLNGKNEEIDLPKEFLEPEIVFYPKSKCLGIQGHPEYGSCPPNTKKICMKLIKKYLLDKDSKKEETKNWHSSFDNDYYHEDEHILVNEEPPYHKQFSEKVKAIKLSINKKSNGVDSNNLNPYNDVSYGISYYGSIEPSTPIKETDNKSELDLNIEQLKSYIYEKPINSLDEFGKKIDKMIEKNDFSINNEFLG